MFCFIFYNFSVNQMRKLHWSEALIKKKNIHVLSDSLKVSSAEKVV